MHAYNPQLQGVDVAIKNKGGIVSKKAIAEFTLKNSGYTILIPKDWKPGKKIVVNTFKGDPFGY